MGKYLWSLIATVPKMKDFTGSHVHCKIRCKIDILLLHTINRKYHMAYQFVPFPMTLDDLEGHSPVA